MPLRSPLPVPTGAEPGPLFGIWGLGTGVPWDWVPTLEGTLMLAFWLLMGSPFWGPSSRVLGDVGVYVSADIAELLVLGCLIGQLSDFSNPRLKVFDVDEVHCHQQRD